jgi:glutathione S-transferase
MSSYKVHYFNYRARAEAIRFLLSYGGVNFEDIRFEEDEWPKIKPSESNLIVMFQIVLD